MRKNGRRLSDIGRQAAVWLACAVSAWSTAAAETPLEKGDLVMPKEECEIRDGERAVTLKGRIMPLVVQSVKGDQVELGCGSAPAATVVRVSEADAYYGEWLKRRPQSVDAYHLRAVLRMHLEDWEGAIADLEAAIALIPNIARLHTKRAAAYYKYRDPVTKKLRYPERVRESCDRAFQLNRGELWAICIRLLLEAEINPGISWANNEDFQRMQMMAPPDAETCEVRGELFRNLMLPVQAIRDFDKAIDLEPYFARCYAGRGRAYGMRGKKIEALRDFDTAIRLSPKQTFGYIARCNFYQDQKEPKLARADGEKALELAPHDIDVLAGFAQALCQAPQAEARDGKRALELANEAYRLDPNDWRTRSAMGAAYAEIGDFAKSEEFYRKALDLKALMSQQEAAITAYYVNRVRSGLPPMHN